MVRKSFTYSFVTAILFLAGLYALIDLIISDRNWTRLVLAAVGAVFIPVAATMFVRVLPKPQPQSKVVIITAIWATWTVMVFISALVIWTDWQNFWPQHTPSYCLDYCYNGNGPIPL